MVKHPIGNTVRKIERAGMKMGEKPIVRSTVRKLKNVGRAAVETGGEVAAGGEKMAYNAGRSGGKLVKSAAETGGDVAAEVGETGGKIVRKAGRAGRKLVRAV